MDENLLKKLDKITISPSEAICSPLDDEDIRAGIHECNQTFGGKEINF